METTETITHAPIGQIDTFFCVDCGKDHPVQREGGTGYAVLPTGNKVCYPCADKRQVEDLKDRSKPFVGYLSGNKVTTWTGGELMQVTRRVPCKLTRRSFTHDERGYVSVRAIDRHGGYWAGRGSDGIAIKMRPIKYS